MMLASEAIKYMSIIKDILILQAAKEALTEAAFALDKEIPRKWQILFDNDCTIVQCPCCGQIFKINKFEVFIVGTSANLQTAYKFCPACGQHLLMLDKSEEKPT